MNTINTINKAFIDYLKTAFDSSAPVSFELNTDEHKKAFGDISTNAAMILAKELKSNPRTLAQKICQEFTHPLLKSSEIAGPGFINIFLTEQCYLQLAHDLFNHQDTFFKSNSTKKKINIEFVSANPTGPLHLGHGRGGIIGDVLGNILRFLGNDVTKEFYINDAGSQIQKLAHSFKTRCFQTLGQSVSMPEDGYHGHYLITLAQECVAQHGISLLDKEDNFFAQYAKEHLLHHIQQTLHNYGIKFDLWFSEKTLHENGSIEKAITLLSTKDYIYSDQNAVWFKSTLFGDDKDRVLRKSTGELTYVAADIAYMENKLERGFETLIYILGQDHHSYVTRLKGLMAALGNNPDNLEVILYQLVTLKEGDQVLRMSKRAGTMVALEDVINLVGKDVARFFYLHRKADAHLDFDLELALKKTEENPVYYIQYAYVRIGSIQQKAQQEEPLTHVTYQDITHLNDDEKLLLKKIIMLQSLLGTIERNYQTHLLTYYVIELAQAFHKYYGNNKVIDLTCTAQSRSRLAIISLIRTTLELCLNLLGISCPQQM